MDHFNSNIYIVISYAVAKNMRCVTFFGNNICAVSISQVHSANFDSYFFSDFFLLFFLLAQSFRKVFCFPYRCITFVFKLSKNQKVPDWKSFFEDKLTQRKFHFFSRPSKILLYKKTMRYFKKVKICQM